MHCPAGLGATTACPRRHPATRRQMRPRPGARCGAARCSLPGGRIAAERGPYASRRAFGQSTLPCCASEPSQRLGPHNSHVLKQMRNKRQDTNSSYSTRQHIVDIGPNSRGYYHLWKQRIQHCPAAHAQLCRRHPMMDTYSRVLAAESVLCSQGARPKRGGALEASACISTCAHNLATMSVTGGWQGRLGRSCKREVQELEGAVSAGERSSSNEPRQFSSEVPHHARLQAGRWCNA